MIRISHGDGRRYLWVIIGILACSGADKGSQEKNGASGAEQIMFSAGFSNINPIGTAGTDGAAGASGSQYSDRTSDQFDIDSGKIRDGGKREIGRSDGTSGVPGIDAEVIQAIGDATTTDRAITQSDSDSRIKTEMNDPICRPPASHSIGQNPLFTDRYTADPAAMVHDCTFYITCGHDEAVGGQGFTMYNWYVLSSTDMVNWTDNGGPVLSLDDFSWADANAWAGQMIARNDKFFWYVPINERGGAMAIGVAVAQSPTGPFTDAIGGPLISDTIEMAHWNFTDPRQTPYTIDPSPFIDRDGSAYLYYGGFWRLVGVRLKEDMVSLAGRLEELQIDGTPNNGGFWEAPYMIRREDTYYLIYAAGQNPATIDYATSDNPLGPFDYRGRILERVDNSPTNHPGVAEFAGQWYFVYHNGMAPGGGEFRRSVCIDKMYFNYDGSIQPVIQTSGLLF